MAISKRLRFEILRRDNHTCRYCGASAPDVKLTVDHVTPEALGGRTEPANLVAACEACNSGKSSIAPDAAVVADVNSDALRWSRALEMAAAVRRTHNEMRDGYVTHFEHLWSDWHVGVEKLPVPLDDNWQSSVERFHDLNLPADEMARAIRVAMTNNRIAPDETFRYFCGICWSVLRELQEAAADIVMAEIADEVNESFDIDE